MRETFRVGTLIVNVAGLFVIGFFATLAGPDGRVFVGTDARQFATTGLCGGHTAFSAFSLRTPNLARSLKPTPRCRSFCVPSRSGQGLQPRPRSTNSREREMTLPRDPLLLRIFIPPALDAMMGGGLVTLEKAQALPYGADIRPDR